MPYHCLQAWQQLTSFESMFVIISWFRLVNYPKDNNSSGWEELTQTLHTRAFHTSAVTVDGGILLVCPTLLHSVTLMIRCSQMMLNAQWCSKMIKWYRKMINTEGQRTKRRSFILTGLVSNCFKYLWINPTSPNLDIFLFDWWSLVVKNYGADLSRGKAKACANLEISFFSIEKNNIS